MIWEHHFEHVPLSAAGSAGLSGEGLARACSEIASRLGGEGWEMVSMTKIDASGWNFILAFKRPAPAGPITIGVAAIGVPDISDAALGDIRRSSLSRAENP